MQNITNTLNALVNANATIMIETATDVKMNKRNNPLFGRVKKHTAYIGVNFNNYTNEVNERRINEGKDADFVAKATTFERVNDYIVRKGEQNYLQFLMNADCKTRSIWHVDGHVATENEMNTIRQFLPQRKASATQGLDNEVQVRRIKLENVVAVGNEYETHVA